MDELKEYFIVYATEDTIPKICNTIEYYSSVEELLNEYYHSGYILINFWRIGDETNE